MDDKGNWRVAPAYDLTFSGRPDKEHLILLNLSTISIHYAFFIEK